MSFRFRASHCVLLLAAVGGSALAAMLLWRWHRDASPAALLARLPEGDSVVAYVDVAALRQAGLLPLLAGPTTDQDADYRVFVERSGFDYETDLDAALIAFQESDRFFLLRGRFDWGRLARYTRDSGGFGLNGVWIVSAGSPDRFLSFFAVTPQVMAMASSGDSWAVTSLQAENRRIDLQDLPTEPLWVQLPGSALRNSEWLPSGTRSFASALAGADRVVLAAGPVQEDFEVRLRVGCRTASDASRLVVELKRTTELLRSLIEREGQEPNPLDLSGVLTAGEFEQRGLEVRGRWPVSLRFLQALASSQP